MATLTVRNIEDDVVRRLRVRAAENGRSAEAEHRAILRAALQPDMTRQEALQRLAEFRRRLAGRPLEPIAEALRETREERMRTLMGEGNEG